jgi:hypothetical protein
MRKMGFELTFPVCERAKTVLSLARWANVVGEREKMQNKILMCKGSDGN